MSQRVRGWAPCGKLRRGAETSKSSQRYRAVPAPGDVQVPGPIFQQRVLTSSPNAEIWGSW